MGATKLMGVGLVTAAHKFWDNCETIFASARFGNVVGSRGAIVSIFRARKKRRRSVYY